MASLEVPAYIYGELSRGCDVVCINRLKIWREHHPNVQDHPFPDFPGFGQIGYDPATFAINHALGKIRRFALLKVLQPVQIEELSKVRDGCGNPILNYDICWRSTCFMYVL
jgi:hypothetical protein